MTRNTVRIEGAADLDRALSDLGKRTAAATIRRAMREALEPMRKAAADAAPRSDAGGFHLADSISIGTKLSKRQRKMAAPGRHFVDLYMGPDARDSAAVPQEFGTRHHRAQPYMRPAWDAEDKPTLDRLRAALWVEIRKATARAARKAARLAKKAKAG